jgi:hypothetical protein
MQTSFSEQHAGLISIGKAIIAHARENSAASLAALAQARLTLSQAVQTHVQAEQALIRSDGGNPRDEASVAVVRKYHDELLAWRRLLIDCNAKWPLKAIGEDAEGFIRDYMPIYRALEERVRWEEEVFYPCILSAAHLGRAAAH